MTTEPPTEPAARPAAGPGTGKIDVSGIQWDGKRAAWTGLVTLLLRAWDNRMAHPVLGDRYAEETMARLDYDFDALARRMRPQSIQWLATLRAKLFDDWSSDFLARHPEATVLHLACGLDSRVRRIAPPATVRWFDLDFPEVIDLRRQLYPERGNYRMIGASVTDPDWLAQVPADGPTLIVAEGLLPYLHGAEVRALLARLTDHFETGELLVDATAPWLSWVSKFSWLGIVAHFGLADPTVVERWNPRLTCVEHIRLTSQYPMVPVQPYRTLFRIGTAVPGVRSFFNDFRFTF